MLILRPYIFNRFPEIISGVSTKIGVRSKPPYYFNLSFSVGDDEMTVSENRKVFFGSLGLTSGNVAYQKQIHEDKVTLVTGGGLIPDSDAMITDKPGIALAVSIADCVPVLLYDYVEKIIAAVHSGWRGTRKKILLKTLMKLKEIGCSGENIIAYIGPSVSRNIYEVGKDVADLFERKYVNEREGKFYLDVSGINHQILLDNGIRNNNIQISGLCTYALKDIFHSYRRDGSKAGRSLAVIMMK